MFMTQANNRFGVDLNIDDATRLLRDNHCNVDDALEAYGRHRERELAGDKRQSHRPSGDHIVDSGVKEVDSEGVVAKNSNSGKTNTRRPKVHGADCTGT